MNRNWVLLIFIGVTVGYYGLHFLYSDRPVPQTKETEDFSSANSKNQPVIIEKIAESKAAEVRKPSAIPPILEVLRQYGEGKDWSVDPKSGGTLEISGGFLPWKGRPKKDLARLAKAIAKAMKIENSDFIVNPEKIVQTSLHQVVTVDQVYAGYPVLRGEMKFFIRDEDSSIYFMSSTAQNSSIKDFNPLLNFAAAEKKLEEHFQGKKYRQQSQSPTPYVYFELGKEAQLVYRFEILVQTPQLQSLEVLLSTSSGEIVSQNSLLVN